MQITTGTTHTKNKKAGQMDKNFNGTFKPSLSETEIYNPETKS